MKFYEENVNSEHTFISLTFKVQENKVGLEFRFSTYKMYFLAI